MRARDDRDHPDLEGVWLVSAYEQEHGAVVHDVRILARLTQNDAALLVVRTEVARLDGRGTIVRAALVLRGGNLRHPRSIILPPSQIEPVADALMEIVESREA